MVQRTPPSLQAWFCLQEIHRTMKTGIAFVPWDRALLCHENNPCMKPTGEKKKKKKTTKPTQDKILYRLPQLVSPELLKNDGRLSFPYWKSYSQPLQNTGLEADVFKPELHTTVGTEESNTWFSSQGTLSIDHTFDFLKVHLCPPLRVPPSGVTSSAVDVWLFLIPDFSTPLLW